MTSFQKTMKSVEVLCVEFNRLTNRPRRAYEPSDAPYPPANIGYAYVRNLGLQDAHRCAIGTIINPGGGLANIHGLSYLHIGDLLRVLRQKMKDPEWMRQQTIQPKRPTDESITGSVLNDLAHTQKERVRRSENTENK